MALTPASAAGSGVGVAAGVRATTARLASMSLVVLEVVMTIILMSIMTLTVCDVVGRYFVGRPVPGALEITELLLGALIFTALPHVTAAREHVCIDLLDSLLPGAARRVQAVLVAIATGACCAFLSYRLWLLADRIGGAGETTATLGLSISPVVYGISIMLGVSALCALATSMSADADSMESAHV